MATPRQSLAGALEALKALQDSGAVAIRSGQLKRAHRERLTNAGFLKPDPGGQPDSAHATSRPFTKSAQQRHHACARDLDVRVALTGIRDASELLAILLEGGHSTIAGRLAGAFRTIGRDRMADDILKAMRAVGYKVNEKNPFEDELKVKLPPRAPSPYVNRIHTGWQSLRAEIIDGFPAPPGIPADAGAYLNSVDDIYVTDAYHSLSIEGYRVNRELIERVRDGAWNPENNKADREYRDAMAARGYWLAFNEVKKSVARVLKGTNAGDVVGEDHGDWYRALFSPGVEAGILKPGDLAGYRNDQVYITNSMHVPVRKEAVLDCMPALIGNLRTEEHPAVRAVLGHWVFVYIHPYMDGNGRMGRFLMNVMLASGGYPWTVIPVERRNAYMEALESASVQGSIGSFVKFLETLIPRGGSS